MQLHSSPPSAAPLESPLVQLHSSLHSDCSSSRTPPRFEAADGHDVASGVYGVAATPYASLAFTVSDGELLSVPAAAYVRRSSPSHSLSFRNRR